MAKQFFNQKVKKRNIIPIKSIVIIAICVVLILLAVSIIVKAGNSGKAPKNAKITIRDTVTTEINNKNIDKSLFFTELENVKDENIQISYSKVDFDKVGEYDVTIKVYDKTYKSKIVVIDTEAPELSVKSIQILTTDSYTADSFVDNCTDNSNTPCQIDFYKNSVDQNGKEIDYSNYTKEGTYTIQIVAKDESGNETSPISTQLTITKDSTSKPVTKPTNCKFGNSEYNTDEYILAIDITDNGCAIDFNLHKNEEILKAANELVKNDEIRIKNEYKALNINDNANVIYRANIESIPNSTYDGIVGQAIHIELVTIKDDKEEIIASYNISTKGVRIYTINKYSFK